MDNYMNKVLLYVYNSPRINEALRKMTTNQNRDDLKSHLIMEISKKSEDKIEKLSKMKKDDLDFYCIRILTNQLMSNTSSFYKTYSVVYMSGNNKNKKDFSIVEFVTDIDLDMHLDFYDNYEPQMTNELKIILHNIRDEQEEDRSLYYKKKVEEIKNILLHIKPVDALLFNFYYFDGLSYSEISRMSGVNWQSIRYSIIKTLEVIKNKLKENDNSNN